MAIEHHVTPDFGHPWHEQPGWELLEAKADTEDELTAFIKQAEKEFWQTWIRDNTGQRVVAMYKPQGATLRWSDDAAHGLRFETNSGGDGHYVGTVQGVVDGWVIQSTGPRTPQVAHRLDDLGLDKLPVVGEKLEIHRSGGKVSLATLGTAKDRSMDGR